MNKEQTRNEQKQKKTAEQRAQIWNYTLQLSFVYEKNLDVTFTANKNTPFNNKHETTTNMRPLRVGGSWR